MLPNNNLMKSIFKNTHKIHNYLLCVLILASSIIGGCVSAPMTLPEPIALDKPQIEPAEAELLDVSIGIFRSGALPTSTTKALGLSEEIRQAESFYIPLQLRTILEKTGYWGAVRLIPDQSLGADLHIDGNIIASDGNQLALDITAKDASGQFWFKKTYNAKRHINQYKQLNSSDEDIYQDVYHQIANDLAQYIKSLKSDELGNIRNISELRFAAQMSEQPFAAYLQHNTTSGRYEILRLPAVDDPQYQRVRDIREREFLLVDTLNGHYDNYYRKMQTPYRQWRQERANELHLYTKARREAMFYQLAGAMAVIGGIAVSRETGQNNPVDDLLIIGGIYGVKKGADIRSESQIHRDVLEEIGDSFSTESQQLLVEVNGETHRLTGSAKIQFQQWRELLQKLYQSETQLDPEISIEIIEQVQEEKPTSEDENQEKSMQPETALNAI